MDGMVVSGYIHMGKPEARIYRYLLDTYALDPGECVFFDDRDVNCTAGEAVGIRSLQILSEEQLIRILDLLLSEAEKA
jgi:putative hydrolase of the HAD superfamily